MILGKGRSTLTKEEEMKKLVTALAVFVVAIIVWAFVAYMPMESSSVANSVDGLKSYEQCIWIKAPWSAERKEDFRKKFGPIGGPVPQGYDLLCF